MKCLQAIWPCESFSHEVTTFTVSEDCCIWTGSSDGAIIKWKLDKISNHIHPILYLCGHMASIKIIINIPCSVNIDNKSIIISIDEDGNACSWDRESGICIATEKYIEFTKSIGITSAYKGKFLYFSLDSEMQDRDGKKESDAEDEDKENSDSKVYTIVSLDYSTLEIMSIFQTNLTIDIFDTSKLLNNGNQFQIYTLNYNYVIDKSYILDFHLFNENENITGILGISSNGKFLYWNMKKKRDNLPNDLIENGKIPTTLDSPLLSASFSETGNEILIMCQYYWCFLSAQAKAHDNFPYAFSLITFEHLRLPMQQPKNNSVKDNKDVNGSEKDKTDTEEALISHAIKHLRENFESSTTSTTSKEETDSSESLTVQYNSLSGGKILHIQNEPNDEEEMSYAKFVFWDREGYAFIVEYDYDSQNLTSREFVKSVGKCFFSVCPSKNILVRVQSINFRCSKDDDAKYSRIHDAKVTIFSYRHGNQLYESITNVCSGKLRDLWYPVEPYETMSTTTQLSGSGRRESIEGHLYNDGLQSTLSYLNEGPPRCQITCMSLIGGTKALPYILVQGFSDGEIHYSSLASYSIPALPQIKSTDSVFRFPSMGKSSGHNGAVLCFLEITFNPGSRTVSESEVIGGYSNDMPILVSGGEDGTIRFWSLDKNEMGKEIFAVFPHTESVMRIIGPSEDSIKPWCDCIISMGEDGVISLTCLKTRKIERIMPGHHFNTTTQIAWDCHRGFIGTLTRHPDTTKTSICIWDLYSGKVDRVLYGDRCEQMFTLYYQSIKEHSKMKSESKSEQQPQSTLSSRVKVVRQSSKALRLLVGPKPDISLLEIDLESLLPSSGRFSGVHDISFNSNDTDVSLVSRIATCLLLLHAWGANHSVDAEICKMAETLKLNNLDASWIKYDENSVEVEERQYCNLHTAKGVSLTQGVVTSESGAVTLQLPFWVNPLIKITDDLKEEESEISEYQKCQRIGPLWQTCPDFVAAQLVCIVSMAKKLMHEGLNEIVCSACSLLVKLYAIKFIHKVPGCIFPSLEMLVNLWDNNHDVLKESARVLMASTTDPEKLSNYKQGDVILNGSDEISRIVELFGEEGHDVTNREILNNDIEILVFGAVCCVHSRLISNDLLNICVPYLTRLITASKTVTSVSILATVIFSEGMSGTEGHKWIDTIEEIEYFIDKILDLYEILCTGNVANRIKASESSSNIIPKINVSRSIRKAKSMTEIENRKHVSFDEKNLIDIKTATTNVIKNRPKHTKSVTFDVKDEKPKAKKRFEVLNKKNILKLPWGQRNIIGNGSSHNLRLERSAYSLDFDNLNEHSQMNETIKYKEVFVTVITTIASLKLRSILITIHNKIMQEKVQEHHYVLAVVSALSSLLKQRDGRKKIIKEIILLIQVFMVPLSFQDTTIKNLIKQSIMSLVLELDINFPMIEINKTINNVAVGNPVLFPDDMTALPSTSNKPEANSEAITLYDLNTGQKKKSLILGRILKQITEQWKEIEDIGISAVSFRKDGEMIAAYCHEINIVCVWDLKMTWQQKLTKGHMVIEPCKLHQIEEKQKKPQKRPNEISNLGYKIKWKDNDQICISEGDNEIEIIDLNVVN